MTVHYSDDTRAEYRTEETEDGEDMSQEFVREWDW